MKYDLAIIGGGAAGMMAAISARQHHPKAKIILFEKNETLGRKILTTGNGRCNITNINLEKDGARHFNSSDFVDKVFKQFGFEEVMNFFTDLGLVMYEEKKGSVGKVFPISDSATSVVNLLTDAVLRSGVEVKKETICRSVVKKGREFIVTSQLGENILASKLIIAAGGKTYPALGADGSGFLLAEKLGHKIVPPIPSGVPLEGKNRLAQELQGLKLGAEIIVSGTKEKISGDLMFTKYGLSGTAALLASRSLSVLLNRENKKEVTLRLSFMPGHDTASATDFWLKRKQKYFDRTIELDWCGVFPQKFANVFLKIAGVAGKYSNISEAELKKVIKLLTDYEWKITATRGWNEAEFVAGGVRCSEINPATLESNKIAGLYFAGEVIDVDGDIGGYNLSWAWSSGFVVGKLV